MKNNDTAPATKLDIGMLMSEIGKSYDANKRWKDEILEANRRWKVEIIDETKRHFDVSVEDIRHDLLGANKANSSRKNVKYHNYSAI